MLEKPFALFHALNGLSLTSLTRWGTYPYPREGTAMQRKDAEIGTKVVFKRDFSYTFSRDVEKAISKIHEGDVFTISRIMINGRKTEVELTTPAGELHTGKSGRTITVSLRDLMAVEEALMEWASMLTYIKAREERTQRLKEVT